MGSKAQVSINIGCLGSQMKPEWELRTGICWASQVPTGTGMLYSTAGKSSGIVIQISALMYLLYYTDTHSVSIQFCFLICEVLVGLTS